MSISRRTALATGAAAITTVAITAPLAEAAATGAALGGDPAIAIAHELRAASKAHNAADDALEEAAHRAGRSCLMGQKACRELGIESLYQEVGHWKARFWELRAQLLDTPATTLRGVLAKLRGFYHDEEIAQIMAGVDPYDHLPVEYAASIYRDLERLSGGLPS